MIQKHRRPWDDTPSRFIVDAIEKYPPVKRLPVLDLPCGFGRHSIFLAKRGYKVVCADHDHGVFDDRWHQGNQSLLPVILDGRTMLPFPENKFSLVLVVHYFTDDLFLRLRSLVNKSGYIILESYGGQGGNWKELPMPKQVHDQLKGQFKFLVYRETRVGPFKQHVSLKMVAKRI